MIEIDWNTIPTQPGVYLWKGINDQVIYVGKAKNLRVRMKQYFKEDLVPKNKLLMRNIVSFDFQVCASELDALVLEQNLINKYEPKYNIKIKSSRTYPYIELKSGTNISLVVSKQLRFNNKSKFFGPYPDGFSARKIIDIISSVLPLDKCLAPNSGKPCLNYSMNRCVGQCIGIKSDNQNEFIIKSIEDFFKGKTSYFEDKLKERILINNKLLNFEISQKLVDSLKLIEKLNDQKTNTFNDTKHRDIINFFEQNEIISISVMHIRFGSINLTSNYMEKKFNPDPKDAVESFINTFYKSNIIPNELVIPFKMEWELNEEIKITIPKEGIKKDLLDLVFKNAKSKYTSNIDSYLNKIKGYDETIDFIKKNITDKIIEKIEMLDISSTMGKEQVGAVIQFFNGEPNKQMYRKYKINDVVGMDDYASMEEVVRRHFKRKQLENLDMPDMFIIDGKFQLNNVKKIFEELEIKNVVLCALVKDDNHRTRGILNDELEEIHFDKQSNVFLFFTRLQDEVHRFVINFHRSRREKMIIESELDKYTFLTESDKQKLFTEFKSIRRILIASESELKKVISPQKVVKFIMKR